MVAGIILILIDFKTLNRKAQSVISLTGVYSEVLSLFLTIDYLLYFVSTNEMISDSFETCAMLVWVTFALSESTGEDK